jgi:hypothetical protein
LVRTGFDPLAVYGFFDRLPLADDSPEIIFVAKKAEDNNRLQAMQ